MSKNRGCFEIDNNIEYNNTDEINRFIAQKNPFRYRGYYYDIETGLYYLNSRYYDPEIGRFINADDIANISSSEFNGLNMYAYCMNNPVMLKDECGHAWWHWLIAVLLVVAAAVAVVATAGGVMAGIAAVGSVLAGGSAVSIGSTIAAGVFIAASTTLLGVGAFAGIEAIKTGSIDTFWNYGETAMWSTISAGVLGGTIGYFSHIDYGTNTPKDLRPFGKYYNTKQRTLTHYNLDGNMSWSKHFTDHNMPGHTVPHWHLELPHTKGGGFGTRWELIKVLIKRLFGG